MGTFFAPTRFSFKLVRNSVRDLVPDRKLFLRKSGVGGGVQNLVLIDVFFSFPNCGQQPHELLIGT